jgi:class 3 adenylate cyclase
LAVRIGVASGQVVIGKLTGERTRDIKVVSGETPNLAVRLQHIAELGGMVIDEAALSLIGRVFHT